ncbi:MAG: TIM-barrel domain-containing protein, partial [Chitinophagaceae bacterium]
MFLFFPLLSFRSVLSLKISPQVSLFISKIEKQSLAGKWTFQVYGENIIKTTFQPDSYMNNEQVSNAVILEPATGDSVTMKEGDQMIQFGNRTSVLSEHDRYSYQFRDKKNNVNAEYFSEHHYKGFRFDLQADEKIFGGGERALPLDRRGYGFSLYNSPAFGYGEGADQLNFSVPFIISSKGYGIFFDNVSSGYLDIGKKNPNVLEAGFSSGELTFYIINGKNVNEILKHYTDLVGRQPIPGRWVFGNLMSRFGYRSEKQLTNTVAAMKAENFPVDAVILDLFWFGDSVRNTLGNLDWVNSKNWPDPEKMISGLKDQGIKTILITEPY